MEAELIVLAEAGAAAVVKAMATDLWPSTRSAVAEMFHRADPERAPAIDAQLDRNDVLVARAESPDDVRRDLFGYWVLELAALLRRDPSCGDPLGQLAASVSAVAAPAPAEHGDSEQVDTK